VKINNVEFEFMGESYDISGRGRVYTARLKGSYTSTQVSKALVGQKVEDKEIAAIEMFAIDRQVNLPIGIIFKGGK